jgi:hypothetical protein
MFSEGLDGRTVVSPLVPYHFNRARTKQKWFHGNLFNIPQLSS